MASLNPTGRGLVDPRQMPRFQTLGNSATEGVSFGGVGGPPLGSATAWTDTQYGIGSSGAQVDSQFTGGAYKTVVSLTGRGQLFGCVGPCIADGADTAYIRITRDGATAVEISWAPGTVNYRIGLGYITGINSAYIFTTPVPLANTNSVMNARNLTSYALVGGNGVELFGGGLRFEVSLLVEMKVDTTQNATANNERRAGAWYRLEP